MDAGAFDLLKAGDFGLESAKQLKISLAGFEKILSNLGGRGAAPIPWGWRLTAS
jgi:hypothetical protein